MTSRGPLGLSLSSGAAGAVGVGAVCVLVAGLTAGLRGLVSALAAEVVVLLFFVVSLYLVEVANRTAPAMTLPAGITVYSLLMSWLGLLAFGTSLPDRMHQSSFAWTVIAATLGWLLVQATAVWRRRTPYIEIDLPTSEPDPSPQKETESPAPTDHVA
jgi:ATP synthase protein I